MVESRVVAAAPLKSFSSMETSQTAAKSISPSLFNSWDTKRTEYEMEPLKFNHVLYLGSQIPQVCGLVHNVDHNVCLAGSCC